jgi:cytochrome c peroxidase
MNGNRLEVLRHIKRTGAYHAGYRALFGALPDLEGLPKRAGPVGSEAEQTAWRALPAARQEALTRAFVNVGKVIAAYERRLLPGPAPFDTYVEALERGDTEGAGRALSPEAVGGLRLFISNDTQCLKCHNGPLFTNGGFHNIGTGVVDGPHPDFGRMIGIQAIMATDLTCLGPYSDDAKRECPDLRFLNRHEDGSFAGAYRVPSLRNGADTAPYMHDGRFSSLDAVIRHYQTPASAGAPIEFRPMADLTPDHIRALAAFLQSLSAPIRAPAALLKPPAPASRTRGSAQARISVMAPVK